MHKKLSSLLLPLIALHYLAFGGVLVYCHCVQNPEGHIETVSTADECEVCLPFVLERELSLEVLNIRRAQSVFFTGAILRINHSARSESFSPISVRSEHTDPHHADFLSRLRTIVILV